MALSSGGAPDVHLLDVSGRDDGTAVRSAVSANDVAVERTTDVETAERAVDASGPAWVVVDGQPDAVADAVGAVASDAGSTTVFAVVAGTDLELVELLAGHCATALERIEREATLRDRTDSLRERNGRLAEFASVVSHDLRNPLTLLRAELRVAEADGDAESFDRTRDAVDRMDSLIEDLLSLARAGEGVAETERVDLERAAVRCWSTTSGSDATLEMVDPPVVEADATRLRQFLENLFRNAVEHAAGDDGDDGLAVTVGALDDGDGFYVADDGPGVLEDERDAVFDSGYTTSEDGTGFGLRTVDDVAGAHGWTVSLGESESGGARFEVRT